MLCYFVFPRLVCLSSSSDCYKLILQSSQTMPWHRKRRKHTDGVDGVQEGRHNEGLESTAAPQPTSLRRSCIRRILRQRRERRTSPKASGYNHFASNVKMSSEATTSDIEAMCESNHWPTAMIAFVAAMLVATCFALSPDTALRVILFGQMLLGDFPPILKNWILLIPILLPMKAQSRMEVVLGLGMLSWLESLDWVFAWKRIEAWSLGRRHEHEETPNP